MKTIHLSLFMSLFLATVSAKAADVVLVAGETRNAEVQGCGKGQYGEVTSTRGTDGQILLSATCKAANITCGYRNSGLLGSIGGQDKVITVIVKMDSQPDQQTELTYATHDQMMTALHQMLADGRCTKAETPVLGADGYYFP